MSEKLKPCPFCGAEAELKNNYYSGYGDSYWIECTNCGVSTDSDWCIETVEKIWNKRVVNERIDER